MTEEKRMINVVIFMCAQNDFIGYMTERELASRGLHLHGGPVAAKRIAGDGDPADAPINSHLLLASQDPNTYIICFEDHHVKGRDDDHFALFGEHCVEGTEGIEAIGILPDLQAGGRRVYVVETDGLKTVQIPEFVDTMHAIIDETGIDGPDQIRILIEGGLTNVLALYLAIGLNSVAGIPNPIDPERDRWYFEDPTNIALSSEYCFSNNHRDHKAGLQVAATVAMQVLNTDQEILDYLEIEEQ